MSFFESEKAVDEALDQMPGAAIERGGDFLVAVSESGTATQVVTFLLAGNHIIIQLSEIAALNVPLFCGKEALSEIIAGAKENVSSLRITRLR